MKKENNLPKSQTEGITSTGQFVDVFGFNVPTDTLLSPPGPCLGQA